MNLFFQGNQLQLVIGVKVHNVFNDELNSSILQKFQISSN